MSLSIPSLSHLAVGVVTLPVRVAARAVGLARGSAAAVHDRVSGPAPRWESVDRLDPAGDPPAPTSLGTEPGPVNVTAELDLDPAPVDAPPAAPRTPPVTEIDAQAEPGLVDSTPADVAARISRD